MSVKAMPTKILSEPRQPAGLQLSLLSLPEELLATIALSLDRSSAFALAQTCRALTSSARCLLDRELDLVLPQSLGDTPLRASQPLSATQVWAAKNHAMATRLEAMLSEGRRDRLAKAKSIFISPPPGPVAGIIELLETISPTLETLIITRRPVTCLGDIWDPPAFQNLDIEIIRAQPSFPHLTRVHIHQYSIHYAELLSFLCSAAPNLVELDADLTQSMRVLIAQDRMLPPLPTIMKDTQIRRLRVIFGIRTDVVPGDDEEKLELAHPVLRILARSPLLQRLSVQYEGRGGYTPKFLAKTISCLPDLRELYWPIQPHEIFRNLDPEKPGFAALRTLVLSCGDVLDYAFANAFDDLHIFPNLEALYFNPSGRCPLVPPEDDRSLPSVARQANIDVVEFIRAHPKLHTIHVLPRNDTDIFTRVHDVEKTGRYNGWVHSYWHGESELLHLRRLTHQVEIADTPVAVPLTIGRVTGISTSRYTSVVGEERRKTYRWQEVAVWEDCTELDGLVVPLEIIEAMRVVEGASVAEWKGRGIDVGDAAWAVLEDWKSRELAAADAVNVGV